MSNITEEIMSKSNQPNKWKWPFTSVQKRKSKTLLIHIGHYKTGTTAIQSFFSKNRIQLQKQGVHYCQSSNNHGKHSNLAFSLLKSLGVSTQLYGYNAENKATTLWQQLGKEIINAPCSTAVISSEEFIRLGEYNGSSKLLTSINQYFKKLSIDIKVVAYFRGQNDHLESWYNQFIKMNYSTPTLGHTIRSLESIHYDYQKALSPWLEAFGEENVIARPYLSTTVDKNHLLKDFLKNVSAKIKHEKLQFDDSDPNPRIDPRIIEMIRMLSNQGLPLGTSHAIQRSWKAFQNKENSLYNFEPKLTDQEINEAAQKSNQWLKDHYHLDLVGETNVRELIQSNSAINDSLLYDSYILYELILLRQQVNRLNNEFSSLLKNLNENQ